MDDADLSRAIGAATTSARWFRVTDHALDRRRPRPQGALERVVTLVYGLHAELHIVAAVQIDDLAFIGLADADIMDVPNAAGFCRQFR